MTPTGCLICVRDPQQPSTSGVKQDLSTRGWQRERSAPHYGPQLISFAPTYEDYQRGTRREIPLVILE